MKLPQLHLRDLFWLVLVVGLSLAWWIDRGKCQAKANHDKGLLFLQRDHWKDQSDQYAAVLRAVNGRRIYLEEHADQLEKRVKHLEAVTAEHITQ